MMGGCYLCNNEEENTHHLFFECPFTILAAAGASIPLPNHTTRSGIWLHDLLGAINQISNDQLDILRMVWQGVWMARNMIWQGKNPPNTEFVGLNIRNQQEGSKARGASINNRISLFSNFNWFSSSSNLCKLNFDARISEEKLFYWPGNGDP